MWRIMRCCGVTVSLARCFILTCNVATAYVRRKQLHIKAPVRAAVLLFFPKQSTKPRPGSTRGGGKRSVASTEPDLRAPSAIKSTTATCTSGSSRSMTMKRMRTREYMSFAYDRRVDV